MLTEFSLNITVAADRNAAVAVLTSECGCEVLATGSAKRMPGDSYDDGIGFNLAVARALINYGKQQERMALLDSEKLNAN